jgi:photosystem II stability/assembly factor-like uncharacterized protein
MRILRVLLLIAFLPCSSVQAQWIKSTIIGEPDAIYLVSIGKVLLAVGGFDNSTGHNVWRTTDAGLTWTPADSGLGTMQPEMLSKANSDLFVGTLNGGLFRSTDSGASWTHVWDSSFCGIFCVVGSGRFIIGKQTLSGGGGGLVRSSDRGVTWDQISIPGLVQGQHAYFTRSDTFLFVRFIGSGIARSSDNGATWSSVNYPTIDTDWRSEGPIFWHNGSLFSIYGQHSTLFRSNDNGDHWAADTIKLHYDVARVEEWVFDGDSSNIFMGVARDPNGIYRSTDNGDSWSYIPGSNNWPRGLAVHENFLFVGFHSGGIWQMPLREMAAVGVRDEHFLGISAQAFPNPVNSRSTFNFNLLESSDITLIVIDAAGRETAIIPSRYMETGSHSITWDASRFPAGVYAYCLTAGGERVVKKLVVIH